VGVVVDSNVLLDIATDDERWAEWSSNALAETANHSILVIRPEKRVRSAILWLRVRGGALTGDE
jgi:hypothetical protein